MTARGRLGALPLRVRLVVGFAGAMLGVLVAAGAFVFWRVELALDRRLDQDLRSQTGALVDAARRLTAHDATQAVADRTSDAQLLDTNGKVVASGAGTPRGQPLLTPAQARRAATGELVTGHGSLFSGRGTHLRIRALPVDRPGIAVAVTAVRLDQRDEALGELLAQLAIANLLALSLASFVGYRLTRAALDPVDDYRKQATRIASGDTTVRLAVPPERDDEITRLGATLNTMLDAQARSTEQQRQFIDDASHELRTPLTTIAAEIDITMRKPRTAQEYESSMHRLATATNELVELTETLLTLGGVAATSLRHNPVPVAPILVEAARRVVDSTRPVGVACDTQLSVHGDATLLARAVGNLVDNALLHGAGPISISGQRRGGHAVLAVHDDGPGIDPDFLPHATERFRRHATSRTGPGTGLGLALVEAITTAHNGHLRICSGGHHWGADEGLPCDHPSTGTTTSMILQLAGEPLRR